MIRGRIFHRRGLDSFRYNDNLVTYMLRSIGMFTLVLVAIFTSMQAAEEGPVKPYPFPDCIISEEKLGSLGKPIALIYEGQEIKVCCRDCKKTFEKNPIKAMAKFEAAVRAQSSSVAKE